MTTQWQGGQTFVNRLRVRGRGLDQTLTQLRLATLLSNARLSPTGLAPSAILCVRHLRDPLPGTLPLHRRTGDITPPLAWERAVASSLEELARSAARPVRETAPASAEAVLFADHAELLACLAADWCDSLAASRWWWKSLFRGTDAASALMPALLSAPAYIPAALEHLSSAGKAEKFARALSLTETRSLLSSLTRSFSLPRLQDALDEAFDGGDEAAYQPDASWAQGASTQTGVEAIGASGPNRPRPAPWQHHVPESLSHTLKPAQQALLGIGLLLLRAPSLARSDAFARNTRSWLQQAERASDARAAYETLQPETQEASFDEAALRPHGPLTIAAEMDERAALPFPVNVETARPPMEKRAGPEIDEEDAYTRQPAQTENESDAAQSSTPVELSSQEGEGRMVERFDSGPMTESSVTDEAAALTFETPRPSMARAYEAYIETELGGIFYLINVALFLELYGDFTMPQEPGLSLDIWDFLSLFGAALNETFYQDPASALLMQLAGRAEEDALGQGFEPPPEWRMPPRWLAAFPVRAACQWEALEGRLRVRHAEGFLVLDVSLKCDESTPPDADEVRARLLLEMEAYRECADLDLRMDASKGLSEIACEADALKRWLKWLAPFVCARLRRALGLAADEELAPLLFEQSARVRVSATHLDVFFGLAELPVEIRLAGIDRDPGWVPAAGRYIAFHYE